MGRQLLNFSVEQIRDIAGIAGCRFVVVNAKRPAVDFYTKSGFRMIDTAANHRLQAPVMFLDLLGIMPSSP